MKSIKYFGLLLAFLSIIACGDDDDSTTLRKDAGNVTAPAFPAGEYEAAVAFSSNDLADHIGKKITELSVYVYQQPVSARINVYQGAGGPTSIANNIIYSASIANAFNPNSWLKHSPLEDLTISGEELWVTLSFDQSDGQYQVIGCDSGPNEAGGDWVYYSSDGIWDTYTNRSFNQSGQAESINWNIRLSVE